VILLDTNILTCTKQAAHPDYTRVTEQLIQYITEEIELVVCPQVLYEFYVVATRPSTARGGLGLTSEEAIREIQAFQQTYSFIDDPAELFYNWRDLIVRYGTQGLPAHDTRLVAFMQAHQINQLFTLNPADFNRYSDIITILN
jgi:predicted nucleic acid-binding protein